MVVTRPGWVESYLESFPGYWPLLQLPAAQEKIGTSQIQVNPTHVRDHHGHPVCSWLTGIKLKQFLFTWWWRRRRRRWPGPAWRRRRWRRRGPPARWGRGRRRRAAAGGWRRWHRRRQALLEPLGHDQLGGRPAGWAAGLEAGDLCLGVCQLGLGLLLEGERGLQLALHARVLPLLLLARLVHQVLDQRLNVHLKNAKEINMMQMRQKIWRRTLKF